MAQLMEQAMATWMDSSVMRREIWKAIYWEKYWVSLLAKWVQMKDGSTVMQSESMKECKMVTMMELTKATYSGLSLESWMAQWLALDSTWALLKAQ